MIPKTHIELYKDENNAVIVFKEFRLRKGVVCKKCGHQEHYWLEAKSQFQCKACKFRTTLRSGTVLEGSKLPISYFFIALHLLIKFDNKLTTEQFQEVVAHKHYEPIFEFLRKMREFIKANDTHKVLIDILEIINELYGEYAATRAKETIPNQ